MKKVLGLLLLAVIAAYVYVAYFQLKWETYESAPGAFSARFPAPPEETVQNVTTLGDPFDFHMTSIGVKQQFFGIKVRDRIYQVGYIDFHHSNVRLEGLIENPPGQDLMGAGRQLNARTDVTYSGMTGREVRSLSNEYAITTRGFLRGQRVYLITIAQARWDFAPDDSDNFLDSLEVTATAEQQ